LSNGPEKVNKKKIINEFFRMINQSSSIRHFWKSKIQVEGNNYDYSQNDSCLRTDLSWHIGLRDYSSQFISIFDQLLTVINDEKCFLTEIQSSDILEKFSPIENDSLLVGFYIKFNKLIKMFY
jgi:hypothetical protein